MVSKADFYPRTLNTDPFGQVTRHSGSSRISLPAGIPKNIQNDHFIKFGQTITLPAEGEIIRIGRSRRYEAGAYNMEDRVSRYEAMIPGAGLYLPKTELSQLEQASSFNRRQRIATFYLLLALAEKLSPEANPDMQVERLRQILIAIENIATEKVVASQSNTEVFVEDPRFMKAQIGDKQAFKLNDQGKVIKAEYKIKDVTAFPDEDSILVIPSTREYTITDKAGRVLVIRMDGKDRNYPYEHMAPDDIQKAFTEGKIIFSIPKNGTDILGRALTGIFIAKEWQVPESELKKLPERQKQNAEAVLNQIPDKPYL